MAADIKSNNPAMSAPHIHDNVLGTLGDTPLVRLNKVTGGVAANIVAKLEYFNPGGSVKDRIGIRIIEDAEQRGLIKPGGTIVESTSGNTGVGLAIAAAIKGYKCVFVLPDKQSPEKMRQLRAYGAKVIVTPTAVEPDDPRSYYSVAKQVVADTPNSILANQYHNPVNPETHYLTTGPEIWRQTRGQVDVFVTGMGTGGTITGVGKFLKEMNPKIQIVGVDPIGSIIYDYFKTGKFVQAHSYKVEGIGEDFIPSVYDFSYIDDMVQITDKESFLMTRRLAREEGLFVGGSSGSAVVGALRYATNRQLNAQSLVIVLLPDSGSRNVGKIFDDEWMQQNRFLDSSTDVRVFDVLGQKPHTKLFTTNIKAKVVDVVAQMKSNDVSQLPVMDDRGALIGLVNEVTLLKYMLSGAGQDAFDQPIGQLDVVERDVSTVNADTALETLMSIFNTAPVVVVVEPDPVDHSIKRPTGILTKIDLLSYLTAPK